jgi:hypothetical protein
MATPEELAIEWVESTIEDWRGDTLSEFVWVHDDVDISTMSDRDVFRLIEDVDHIIKNKIIITIGE